MPRKYTKRIKKDTLICPECGGNTILKDKGIPVNRTAPGFCNYTYRWYYSCKDCGHCVDRDRPELESNIYPL